MSLAGSVESFPLQAVLSLLESTSARGALVVTTAAGPMELQFQAGALVGWLPHASTDPVDVVARLFADKSATFAWHPGDVTVGCGPIPLPALISSAEERATQWAEMGGVVSSPEHRLVLVPGDHPGVALDSLEWNAVCAVGSGRPMSEVVEVLGGSRIDVYRCVRGLLEQGLVAVVEPDAVPQAAASVAGEVPVTAPHPTAIESVASRPDSTGAEAQGEHADAFELPHRRLSPTPRAEVDPVVTEPADGEGLAGWSGFSATADEALGDRGPWPSEQLRALVEEAHRETDAVLAEAAQVARAVGEEEERGRPAAAFVPAQPPVAAVEAQPAVARVAERSTLLRFFSAAKAS